MIKSATRPLIPNLVIVRLAGARPRIGEIVTPGVYFLPFFKKDSNDNNIGLLWYSAKWTKRLDEHLQMPTVKPTRIVLMHVQRDAYTQ